uniref:Uncharacterized protein n=1 Tax=Ascaris lumbricoides TaxID=6252 RepID=A0A0M3I9R2_ASCLU
MFRKQSRLLEALLKCCLEIDSALKSANDASQGPENVTRAYERTQSSSMGGQWGVAFAAGCFPAAGSIYTGRLPLTLYY